MEINFDKPWINVHKLAKNPIGIICLLIVFVCIVVALILNALSKSGAIFNENQKWALIILSCLLPLLSILLIYRLITHHHTKFYAPGDYQDNEGFFRALTPDEQKRKIEQEVKSLMVQLLDSSVIGHERDMRKRDLLEKHIRSKVLLAQELAIRQLETEYSTTIIRQVAAGRDYELDGVFQYNNFEIGVEIKFVRNAEWSHIGNQMVKYGRYFGERPTFIPMYLLLVLVIEDVAEIDIKHGKEMLFKLFEQSPIKIKIKDIRLDHLEKIYGIGAMKEMNN